MTNSHMSMTVKRDPPCSCTGSASGPGECSVQIHALAETYLGLPLIHHLYLEELADHIAAHSHPDFMLIVAPLRIVGGTGSPVSPTAII